MAVSASVEFVDSKLDSKLKISKGPGRVGTIAFAVALVGGATYVLAQLVGDLAGERSSSVVSFVFLGIALLIARGFEFVNGFHDTANAVATVIYTHTLPPHAAVIWSGIWNFIGVLVSSGVVAFGIISLLPVELILQVGSGADFAMVFALLTAAILWNLGTWYFGLPSSSSHTLIGSIIGVGIANQLMGNRSGTSGVDWGQAKHIGESLLISPLVGSNDGQKGMGLIMLILIGTVLTAYALNHAIPASHTQDFSAVSHQAVESLQHYVPAAPADSVVEDARSEVASYIRTRKVSPTTVLATQKMVGDISADMAVFQELAKVPADKTRNFRNDMYLVSEALRLFEKTGQPAITARDKSVLKNYKKHIDVAMTTIGAADMFGLPVSTTHVLSSGVAGTMTANKSGLQFSTVRNLLMAWVLTLPISIALSGVLFWLFTRLGGGV